jgi:hypothetical protein
MTSPPPLTDAQAALVETALLRIAAQRMKAAEQTGKLRRTTA